MDENNVNHEMSPAMALTVLCICLRDGTANDNVKNAVRDISGLLASRVTGIEDGQSITLNNGQTVKRIPAYQYYEFFEKADMRIIRLAIKSFFKEGVLVASDIVNACGGFK